MTRFILALVSLLIIVFAPVVAFGAQVRSMKVGGGANRSVQRSYDERDRDDRGSRTEVGVQIGISSERVREDDRYDDRYDNRSYGRYENPALRDARIRAAEAQYNARLRAAEAAYNARLRAAEARDRAFGYGNCRPAPVRECERRSSYFNFGISRQSGGCYGQSSFRLDIGFGKSYQW
jgi:hypothetical protein